MPLRYINLFLLSIFFHLVHGQTMRVSSFGVYDGLSQSTVFCMHQDSRGLMWIGTAGGLNKFDGTKFTVYKYRPHAPYSISSNMIRAILEDKWGNLWIGTGNGLNKFDRLTGRFHKITPDSIGELRPLFIEKDSLLYFVTEGKVGIYNMVSKKFTYYDQPNISVGGIVPQKRKGMYWIISDKGVYTLNTHEQIPLCKADTLLNSILPDPYTNSLVEINEYIWVGTWKGTIRYNTKTHHYDTYKEVTALYYDNSQRLWGHTFLGIGLLRYDSLTQHFRPVSFDGKPNFPRNICCLYSDSYKNLWIGTDGYELYVHNPSAHKFKLYDQSSLFSNANLSSNFIKCFSTDSYGRTWVGTFGDGINVIDFSTHANTRLLGKQTVHTLLCSGTTMWIGTERGIYRCDTRSLAVKRVPFDSISIYWIKLLSNGSLLLSTAKGAYIAANEKSSFVKLFESGQPMKYAYEDRNHGVWLADLYKIYFALPPYKDFKEITIKEGKETLNFTTKCFMEDTVGNMWIASNSGLIRYNPKDQKHYFYTEQNGLPDLMVYGILRDSLYRFWLSTNEGISCFNPYNKTFRNFDVNDGLQSNEFNSGAFYTDASGTMYFGGINGFNVFDPLRIKENKNPPVTTLVSLKVADTDYPIETDYSELKQLALHHSENTVSFEFAVIEYGNTRKNRYSYMLEGVDHDWVESGTRGFARYANIRPGEYLFKVKATNSDGLWGKEQPLLWITIAPPWWQTWWAIITWLVIIIAIVFFSIRFFINKKLEEQLREVEKLQAVNRERTRISKDMHDDLGSGLSRIAIMSELLKRQPQQEKNEQVDKISKTASDLIDSMSHIIWAMNPENDRISNLVAYIREHAAEFLESCGLNCELNFSEDTPEILLTQESRRNIFLVIKESLNNIVKHASARNVQINIDIKNSMLRIVIKDDGKGFDCEKIRKEGNGLRNMKKRMEQVHGTYEIYSVCGQGTITTLSLPADAKV